ncbi:MAG TPA: Gfo/Idh/MocA family oxidoreductase [Dehalococcoidia bacterium]
MSIRVGIVGSRFVATAHAEGLRQVPGVELTAVASPNAEHAWEFRRRFEIEHAFADYKDMLSSGFIDAVTVACPNNLHAQVVIDAAAAGKHVLVDKPMAISLSECDRMIDACKKAGVILMYGENLCFAPKYVRAKQLADEGALGDVYYVRQLECHSGPHSDWFWDINRSGGGVLMDMGCHSIAYCRWVFGDTPIQSVYAEASNFVHGKRTRGDDHTVVMLRFAESKKHPRGGLGVAENAWARAGGLDDRAEIYGSKGLTVADIARGGALHTYSTIGYGYAGEKAEQTRGWTWTSFDEAWNYGFPQEMAHFADCIENEKQPILTGEDGRAVLEIICAAYQSARTGARVSLPLEADSRKPVDYWLKGEPQPKPRAEAPPSTAAVPPKDAPAKASPGAETEPATANARQPEAAAAAKPATSTADDATPSAVVEGSEPPKAADKLPNATTAAAEPAEAPPEEAENAAT